MRTTVDIPDELLRTAKERAAGRGETVSRLVERALRGYLEAGSAGGDEPFVLLEAGHAGGRFPSPSEVQRLLDEEEWRRPDR
jgi:hypothetical protein